ncbi:paired small multidrug resistance pump [Kushneria sinocarnis]|uniref:Paired small multidrug resistance pump n=1 Tax=Kushneria sinocarnis TaxID=595502 RepID=A0A420WZQ8_9GAMM|nr:SMR family transporter [Kushneria sinocarnis]RKR06848.1 paired small multidrug resistance pump [Kushneria sinocarnis]
MASNKAASARQWWLMLPAAACEVGWAMGAKYADGVLDWAITLILVAISLTLATRMARHLPTSTVYTVFVGLGAAGTVAVDILFLGTPANPLMLMLVVTLLIGVIGLRRRSAH